MDDLLTLMQRGDAQALDRLAKSAGPRLLAVARRACRSQHDAEDAVQLAVQQALEHDGAALKSFRGDGSPLAWLSTLVARSCFRLNRKAENDPARTVFVDDADVAPCGGGGPCTCDDTNESPEAQAERAEQNALWGEQLSSALMTLSRVDRLAFLLSVEGHSSDAIAARFGLSSDAVRSRLKRARHTLRGALADVGADLAAR
jgi:RNA polymerase sigma factor (sigma-70 family)